MGCRYSKSVLRKLAENKLDTLLDGATWDFNKLIPIFFVGFNEMIENEFGLFKVFIARFVAFVNIFPRW